jgi:predicted nuclease of predicted toxin-antitoxin system
VRFLIDRCAGRRLAEWLRSQGHDVVESRELGPDPGDRALLERAAAAGRILVTIDTDFGELVYVEEAPHAGLVRLPDVPAERRITLMAEVLARHRQALETQAIITIRSGRIRISRPPSS